MGPVKRNGKKYCEIKDVKGLVKGNGAKSYEIKYLKGPENDKKRNKPLW